MTMRTTINELGKKAKIASVKLRVLNTKKKKTAYEYLKNNIQNNVKEILNANSELFI